MANLLLDAVSVQDLPRQWADQLDVPPEQQVEVFITTSTGQSRMAKFDRITQSMSDQAKQAGLTEKKLIALLDED